MIRSRHPARMSFIVSVAAIALAIGVAALAAPADRAGSDKDYTKHPGYFDFKPIVGDMESSVDILLKGSLLVIAREAVADDDPELGNALSKIAYVRIQVFSAKGSSREQLTERAQQAARELGRKGWELAVRAREEGEEVQVYWLPGEKDAIWGLVVTAIEEDDEAAFINIVGEMNPVEIGRISRALHMDSLDIPMKVEVKGDAEVIVDDNKGEDKR